MSTYLASIYIYIVYSQREFCSSFKMQFYCSHHLLQPNLVSPWWMY